MISDDSFIPLGFFFIQRVKKDLIRAESSPLALVGDLSFCKTDDKYVPRSMPRVTAASAGTDTGLFLRLDMRF